MTVGLTFGSQELFANPVSSIIILFERPIRIGDVVTTEIRASQIHMGHPIYTIMLFHILDGSDYDATTEQIRKELRHMDDRYSHAAAEILYSEMKPHVQSTVDLVNKFNKLNVE